MDSIQNNTNVNFRANVSKTLQKELLGELRKDAGPRYLSRLSRRLEKFPSGITIQDIAHTNVGTSYVRLNHLGDSRVFEVASNGNSLDLIEGLLHKDKSGTSLLGQFIYRLFGM